MYTQITSKVASTVKIKTQIAFWRAAAKATGFAIRHKKGLYRALTVAPVAIVALAAFILGRGVGLLLDAGVF